MALGFFHSQATTARLARLHSLALFVELSPAELAVVDALMHERDYLPGEVVFDQGEDGQAVYIVLDGEVAIVRHDPAKAAADELARLTVGTFFGELALLDSAPRMAQARAVGACKLAVFFRDDFIGLLDTHGRIASKVARQLARHIGRRLRELAIAVGAHQHL
jgi:CRP-like cAMP-binding protein